MSTVSQKHEINLAVIENHQHSPITKFLSYGFDIAKRAIKGDGACHNYHPP